MTKRLLLLALLAGGLTAPLRAQLTDDDRAALADLAPQFAQTFSLTRGWYRGRTIHYYDFGPQAVTISPMFLVVRGFNPDGTPRLVEGQRPIFSSIPGVRGYSAVWQVHFILVGNDYVANTLRDGRSAVALALRGAARMVVPGVFVNCPIVPANSTLQDDPERRPLLTGWYKGAEVPFFDFGRAVMAPAPIYAFATGFDGETPLFLRAQANVVDVVPSGGAEYRDLWDVHFVIVPSDYAAETIRSQDELERERAAGRLRIQRAGMVRNCPVVMIDSAAARRATLAQAVMGLW
ncbi:MAG TPA: hypothetical protein VNL98_00535 [Gemmatimonadales bacterium]|nr:hypothetical protein [Gemmatimonadales bacterium]